MPVRAFDDSIVSGEEVKVHHVPATGERNYVEDNNFDNASKMI
jgi:hypothetical protein